VKECSSISNSKFQFYEIVRIRKSNPDLGEIHGERGAILGIARDECGAFEYGVFIFRDEICWSVAEDDLESTGEHSRREDFYDNSVIKVKVDEQGRGWPADSL